MPKDTYIRIRLTTDEKKEIKERAQKTHSNMSELILNAIRNHIKGEK